jgi:hypothetical protein
MIPPRRYPMSSPYASVAIPAFPALRYSDIATVLTILLNSGDFFSGVGLGYGLAGSFPVALAA